jgi:hypothetical protein
VQYVIIIATAYAATSTKSQAVTSHCMPKGSAIGTNPTRHTQCPTDSILPIDYRTVMYPTSKRHHCHAVAAAIAQALHPPLPQHATHQG